MEEYWRRKPPQEAFHHEPHGWIPIAPHKEEFERRRVRAREVAREIARRLVEEFGARRVWLIGSAVGVWVFHCHSDIDIIVEDIDPENLRRAEWELGHNPEFEIDFRERSMFTDERWGKLIPQPVLLHERPEGAQRAPGAAP